MLGFYLQGSNLTSFIEKPSSEKIAKDRGVASQDRLAELVAGEDWGWIMLLIHTALGNDYSTTDWSVVEGPEGPRREVLLDVSPIAARFVLFFIRPFVHGILRDADYNMNAPVSVKRSL